VCQNKELNPLLFCHRLIVFLPNHPFLSISFLIFTVSLSLYTPLSRTGEYLLCGIFGHKALVKCLLTRNKAVQMKLIPNEQRHNFQN